MELKAELIKPFTPEDKVKFITEQNHKLGYEIKYTENSIEAWGQTNSERLKERKQERTKEANLKAVEFLNGEAVYEIGKNLHIEASDSNIAKLSSYMLDFLDGSIESFNWTTKEDKVIEVDKEGLKEILKGIRDIQAEVWNVKYTSYVALIKKAKSITELEKIEIDYSK